MFSIGLYDWLPSGGPSLRGGVNLTDPSSGDLKLPQKPSRAYGAMVTIPTKGWSRLEVSFLTMSDSGSAIAARDLFLLGTSIPQNEPLATGYSLRHIKASWNYLTYPNPPQDAKLRIKTLWEVHYVSVKPSVELTSTAPGVPFTQTQSIILPAVGLGVEYVASRHFRMEIRGSGMALPHRAALGDADATAVVRVRSLEVFAGGKGLYFRTSPQNDTYTRGLLWGPYGGLRWVFR